LALLSGIGHSLNWCINGLVAGFVSIQTLQMQGMVQGRWLQWQGHTMAKIVKPKHLINIV
jgi:hypothetical protein